jgi:hypothetical protein
MEDFNGDGCWILAGFGTFLEDNGSFNYTRIKAIIEVLFSGFLLMDFRRWRLWALRLLAVVLVAHLNHY